MAIVAKERLRLACLEGKSSLKVSVSKALSEKLLEYVMKTCAERTVVGLIPWMILAEAGAFLRRVTVNLSSVE